MLKLRQKTLNCVSKIYLPTSIDAMREMRAGVENLAGTLYFGILKSRSSHVKLGLHVQFRKFNRRRIPRVNTNYFTK